VRFAQRLRDEVRFDGLDALVAQLHRDVAATRELLKP
jgi:riboflavin kinase/FMN adenylyltransferase